MTPSVVLMAALALGQHCGTSYGGYGQNYGYSYAPTYSYGYSYTPSYYPSYSYYTPAYVAPKVVIQKQVVTKFVEVVPKYQYSGLVADYDRQEKQQEAATAEVQGLKAEIAKLTTTITSLQQAPAPQVQAAPQQQPVYYPQPAPQQPIYQAPVLPQKSAPQSYVPTYPQQQAPPKADYQPVPTPYSGAPSPPPATPSTAVSGVSLSRCVDCHTGAANRGGGFQIFTAPGVLANLTPDDWQAMEDQIRAGLMPKRGPQFNPQELQAFLQEKAVATGQSLANR